MILSGALNLNVRDEVHGPELPEGDLELLPTLGRLTWSFVSSAIGRTAWEWIDVNICHRNGRVA
jgi:hypothetical protein